MGRQRRENVHRQSTGGGHGNQQPNGQRIPKRFGFDPVRDIQVLCPMNRSALGARSLNIEAPERAEPAW